MSIQSDPKAKKALSTAVTFRLNDRTFAQAYWKAPPEQTVIQSGTCGPVAGQGMPVKQHIAEYRSGFPACLAKLTALALVRPAS